MIESGPKQQLKKIQEESMIRTVNSLLFILRRKNWIVLGLILSVLIFILTMVVPHTGLADDSEITSIAGKVKDQQGQTVKDAHIKVFINGEDTPVQEAETNEQGIFLADLPAAEIEALSLEITHPQFVSTRWDADGGDLLKLTSSTDLRLPDFELERQISAGFWVAAAVFMIVLTLIITERMHSTLAALLGAGTLLVISLVGSTFYNGLYIFDFDKAIDYVDFNVIFLVLGMMIIVGTIERTGIFQWIAYHAYRISRGKLWLLAVILMLFTSVASALLDNVTTMLLVAPITIQIALTLGVNPLALLIPEMLASNIGGIATLIGTPNNILIGSYAGLGFNDFLSDLTPGVLMVQVVITMYVLYIFRSDFEASSETESENLLKLLKENAQITEPKTLRNAGIVFIGTLILFVVGESFHLVPAVTAVIGAAVTLVMVSADVDDILRIVDWSTLLFFMALFMIVGAVQEVGLISMIADGILNLVAGNLTAAALAVLWGTGLMCLLVPTIPLTAALLPIAGFLTRVIPGAGNNILYYSLSMGSALGANNSLIGATNNMVTAGIAKRAGFPISYKAFIKVGFPAALISLLVGSGYILLRF
jgi:Na+/H+ antiporter NhaD/arsenite permease-like protein